MKRLLAILAVTAGLTLGFNTASASAANCIASAGSTHNAAGSVKSTIQLTSCSGITAVQFIRLAAGTGQAQNSGWYDFTGSQYLGYAQWATATAFACGDVCTVTTTNGSTQTMVVTCWYSGPNLNPRGLNENFIYRIKNAAYPYNWGVYHTFFRSGSPAYVLC